MPTVRRWLRAMIVVAATAVLGAMVAATVVWSQFDPRWLTFLGGVLFAAVLAVASQVSRAEWRVARRERQLERMRTRLEEEAARSRAAGEGFKACEQRLRALADALPEPVAIVDRAGVCRFANQAFAAKFRVAVERVDGCALKDFVAAGGEALRRVEFAEGACVFLGALPARAEAPDVEVSAEEARWDDPRERLLRALREDEFLLLGQPIVPLARGAEPLCEILLRLKEEEENLLPPGSFFAAAERYGMMESLDRWVVADVLKHRAAAAPLYCVNLSTAAITSAEFPAFVREQLRERKFDGRGLCFELAEPDLAAHTGAARALIDALKPLGCRFTADAFGSGKGSFAPLRGLAVDFVKIDGVIVQNLGKAAELARAKAMVAVCQKLGIHTIAEFVEDEAVRNLLRTIGVDYVQGFGVARPKPLFVEAGQRAAAAS